MSLSLLLSILLQAAGGLKTADEGAVAGMLRLHDGVPASGVRVAVMAPPTAARGEPQGAGTLVIQGQSDDSGKYRLEGVPPGRYYVVVGRLDAPAFYPGVREFAKARVINVGPRTTVGDIDFEVDSAMLGTPPDLKDPPRKPGNLSKIADPTWRTSLVRTILRRIVDVCMDSPRRRNG